MDEHDKAVQHQLEFGLVDSAVHCAIVALCHVVESLVDGWLAMLQCCVLHCRLHSGCTAANFKGLQYPIGTPQAAFGSQVDEKAHLGFLSVVMTGQI